MKSLLEINDASPQGKTKSKYKTIPTKKPPADAETSSNKGEIGEVIEVYANLAEPIKDNDPTKGDILLYRGKYYRLFGVAGRTVGHLLGNEWTLVRAARIQIQGRQNFLFEHVETVNLNEKKRERGKIIKYRP